jgi:ABC-type multidrug transport system fused ATPase/permease subunit
LSDWNTINSEHASAFSVTAHCNQIEPSSPVLTAASVSAADPAALLPVKAQTAVPTSSSINAAAGGSGAVTLGTYLNYFNAAPGKAATIVVSMLVFVVGQVIRVGADYWLAIWSSNRVNQSQSWYLIGYWIFVFVLVPYIFFRSWFFLYALLQASRKLHDDLFHAVVNGVTSFFDVVPCGHIISRLSTDTDVLDDQLPEFMEQTISLWLVILSIVLVVSTQYPWFVLPLVALMVMFIYVNEFFRRSSREMQVEATSVNVANIHRETFSQKIDSTSRAPILSWFAECVQGIDSVRAFGAAPRVAEHFEKLVDANTRPKFCFFVASRWIGLRLDLLCCLVTLAAALFRCDRYPTLSHHASLIHLHSVWARGNGLDGATVGFVLSYALQVLMIVLQQASVSKSNVS